MSARYLQLVIYEFVETGWRGEEEEKNVGGEGKEGGEIDDRDGDERIK